MPQSQRGPKPSERWEEMSPARRCQAIDENAVITIQPSPVGTRSFAADRLAISQDGLHPLTPTSEMILTMARWGAKTYEYMRRGRAEVLREDAYPSISRL